LTRNYLWATGHHPFGPFTSTSSLSQIYLDLILRNAILSRVTSALALVQKAVHRVDAFSDQYVQDGFGDLIEFSSHGEDVVEFSPFSLASLFQNSQKATAAKSPLPVVLVQRLFGDLLGLESQLKHLATLLSNCKLGDANLVSGSIVETARAFYLYVENEINSARLELECCEKKYQLKQHTSTILWGRIRNFLYGCLFLFIVGFVYFISSRLSPSKPGFSSHSAAAQYGQHARRQRFGGNHGYRSDNSHRY